MIARVIRGDWTPVGWWGRGSVTSLVVGLGLTTLMILAACQTSTHSPEPAGVEAKLSIRTALVRGLPTDDKSDQTDIAAVVVNNLELGVCTGSLIGSCVVLTAKHCVQPPESPVSSASLLSVELYAEADTSTTTPSVIGVREVMTTPGFYSAQQPQRDVRGIDLALLVLDTPVSWTPYGIVRDSAEASFASLLRGVGFGESVGGRSAVRRSAFTAITNIEGNALVLPATSCQGDSGGPLLNDRNQVLGIASLSAQACGDGFSTYNRIDAFLSLVDSALSRCAPCAGDGDERCDQRDNDCDGMVDEDCNSLGATCRNDQECSSGLCLDTTEGRICSQPCDPNTPTLGCGAGLYCQRISGCDGFCVVGTVRQPAAGVGSVCEQDTDCASLWCRSSGDATLEKPTRLCAQPCKSNQGSCLPGELCIADDGECGQCTREPGKPTAGAAGSARGKGEPCDTDSQCASGECEFDRQATGGFCTHRCDQQSDCGAAFGCEDGFCQRRQHRAIGANCAIDADCPSTLICQRLNAGRSYCASLCGLSTDCPLGYDCDGRVCVPQRRLLGQPCDSDPQCLSNACIKTGMLSSCSRFCSALAPCDQGYRCARTAEYPEPVCVARTSPAAHLAGGGACSVSPRTPFDAATCVSALALGLGLRQRRRRRSRCKRALH